MTLFILNIIITGLKVRETDGTMDRVRLTKTGRRWKPFYPGREAKTFHFTRGRHGA